MITRLYADNFKTLVNFELQLGPMNLLLGANGCRKVECFGGNSADKEFCSAGEKLNRLFPTSSLCRWDTRKIQTFELDLRGEEGTYTYKLEIEHDVEQERCRVKSERLTYNQRPLYVSDADGLKLYHGRHSLGKKFLIDRYRSGVGLIRGTQHIALTIQESSENGVVAHIDPDRMANECETEDVFPERHVELRGLVSTSCTRSANSDF